MSLSPAAEYIFNLSIWMPDPYKAPYSKYGPGQFVLSRSPETRAMLSQLKSEDMLKIRNDLILVPPDPREFKRG